MTSRLDVAEGAYWLFTAIFHLYTTEYCFQKLQFLSVNPMAFFKMTTYVDNDNDVDIFLCILRLMKGTLFPHFSPHHWKMPSPPHPSSLQTRSDELNRHCLTKCQRRNKSSTRHHQRRKVTGKAKNEDHQAVITVLLASSLPINFLILILFLLLPTHSDYSSFDIVISFSFPSYMCGRPLCFFVVDAHFLVSHCADDAGIRYTRVR